MALLTSKPRERLLILVIGDMNVQMRTLQHDDKRSCHIYQGCKWIYICMVDRIFLIKIFKLSLLVQ